MSSLAEALTDYLTIRRRLGFKLEAVEGMLRNFIAYLEELGERTVTTELAVAWARRPQGVHPSWWGARLSTVRRLASFPLATSGPRRTSTPQATSMRSWRRRGNSPAHTGRSPTPPSSDCWR